MSVEAEASVQGGKVRVRRFNGGPPEDAAFPGTIVNYVRRTRESVVLDDAALDRRFSADPYIKREKPKSVLCLPLIRQAKLWGFLYLENNLTPGAFTRERLSVLELLTSQAAISMDNARLYSDLRASEEHLRAIIDNTTSLIYMKDVNLRYMLINRPLEKLLGKTMEQVVGKTDRDLVAGEFADALNENDRRVLASGMVLECEETAPCGGSVHTYISVKFPLRDADGAVYALCGISTDITERKRVEWSERFLGKASEQLASSLEYETTLKSVADLAVPELADGCIVYLSEEGCPLRPAAAAGASQAERDFLQALSTPPLSLEVTEGPAQAMKTGRPVLRTQLGSSADERVEVLHVPLRPLGGCSGVISLFVKGGSDVSALANLPLIEELARRAALSLENARHYCEAREAIRVRDEFLSIASHELRTPLTPLKLQLQGIERHLGRGQMEAAQPRQKLTLAIALRQVKRLEALVNNLLDMSRICTGRLMLEAEPVDLTALVREVAACFGEQLDMAGSTLELSLDAQAIGRWDRLRLEQVIVNLLTNAIKFGSGKPIEIAVRAGGEVAVLSVRDHGIGIRPENLQRLFRRFEQAVSARAYGGLGLGLYITRQIVEAHGGSIRATSELDVGSLFTVELPWDIGATAPDAS